MSLLMSGLELGKCEYVWKRRAEIASLKEKRMKITRKKTPPDFAAAGSSEHSQLCVTLVCLGLQKLIQSHSEVCSNCSQHIIL